MTTDIAKYCMTYTKENRLLRPLIVLAIIILITIAMYILGSCKPQEQLTEYRMQAVDIAWLKIDQSEWRQRITVKNICEDLNKSIFTVEYRVKERVLINIFGNSYIKTKTIAYIPVTYQDMNVIKKNFIGTEKMVISAYRRSHNIIYDSIDNDPELKKYK
ncbi:MAG: hypothetical protein ACFFD1_00835 [Candidatus Thorarchaeota archaeon]